MNALLNVFGFLVFCDLVFLLYFVPKCRHGRDENDYPVYWIPFSFHYKLFACLAFLVLGMSTVPSLTVGIFLVLYVFNFQIIFRGWSWHLEDPFTSWKMDVINLKEGKFQPSGRWSFDYMIQSANAFWDRYIFDLIFFVTCLLNLLDPNKQLLNTIISKFV